MKTYQGQTLSWGANNGVIELELHRDPANEIGSRTLEELEKFAASLKELAEHNHALILHSSLKSGFSAGADLRELFERSQQMEKNAAARGVREFLERIHDRVAGATSSHHFITGIGWHRGVVAFPLSSLRKIENRLLRFWAKLQLRHSQPQPVLLGCWNSGSCDRYSWIRCHPVAIHVVAAKSRYTRNAYDGCLGRRWICTLSNLYRSLCAAGLLHPVSHVVGYNRSDRLSLRCMVDWQASGVKLSTVLQVS